MATKEKDETQKSVDRQHPPSFDPSRGYPFNSSAAFSDRFSAQDSELCEDAGTFSRGGTSKGSRGFPRLQYTKLEVVQARQIERLLLWQHIFIGLGVAVTLIFVVLASTVYAGIFSPQQWQGRLRLKVFDIPDGLQWFNHLMSFFSFGYALLLATIYGSRILRVRRRDRTHEQIWVLGLLISLACFLIPWHSFVRIYQLANPLLPEPKKLSKQKWFKPVATFFFILRQAAFTGSTLFYVWASAHSYRLLESGISVMFYATKVAVLGLYVAVKTLVYFQYEIQSADPMLTSFFGMLSIYRTAKTWVTAGIWYGCLSMLFETGLGSYILWEIYKTRTVLKNADYLKYRSKQIGFRFFVYHNLVFYFSFWVLYLTLLLAVPQGIKAFQVVRGLGSNFEVHDFKAGIEVMLLAYATVEAYANLPADALGLKGWFVPQFPKGTCDTTELEPITYRKREPPSLKGVVSDVNVNCFVMQTHVTMFNFAWLVYYWDTPKVEDFKLTQDVFKFSVAQFIKDKPTDTHVLVIDGADRIVIAFKGTTSTKNLRTDVNAFYSNARNLLPTMLGGEHAEKDETALGNPLFSTKAWKRSKIHKGFAIAYASVGPILLNTVQRLQSERKRPVFLTGHSLGGALATLCSLDLHLRLGISRRDIFVSTFGAPRVCNHIFAKIYDEHVPIHWRIVVGPDVVAKLPKLGFTHVGKKVLITVDGDLFIDPNSLELNLWTGDLASILYHRKASYLLAMRAWCERHHGDEYLPEFWPFPVSKDDTRRFEHAMVRSVRAGSPTSQQGQIFGGARYSSSPASKRSRMRQMDAMIDALTGPDEVDASPEVLKMWERLVLRVIEQSRDAATGESAVA